MGGPANALEDKQLGIGDLVAMEILVDKVTDWNSKLDNEFEGLDENRYEM